MLDMLGYRSFSFRLRQLSDQMTQDIMAVYKEQGISIELHHITVLALLDHQSPLTNHDLSCATQLSKASISKTVSYLVHEGYMRESRPDNDKRRKNLSMTAKGKQTMKKIRPVLKAADQVFHALSQEMNMDVIQFTDLAEKALAHSSVRARFKKTMGG